MTLSGLLNDLELVGAVVVGAVTVLRVGMIRQANSRLLWFALLNLAVGQTLQVEGVYREVEQLVGTPGAAALIKHGAALFAAANTAAVVGTLLPRAEPHNHRRPWVGLAAALVLSAAPWVISSPTHVPAALANRAEYYDPTWRSAVHWLAFLGYLGWSLWVAASICWRFRRVEEHAPTRTAVTLVGLGTTIGGGYILEKAITVIAWLAGYGAHTVELDQAAEAAVLASSVSLIAIGTAYEAAMERIYARRREQDFRRVWRGLRPLVDQLEREYPDIQAPGSLTPPERVVASVAMIHEALKRLTAYAPPPRMSTAGTDDDLATYHAAAWLRQALATKAAGGPAAFAITASPIADTGRTTDAARYLTAVYDQAGTIERSLAAPPGWTGATEVRR